MKEWRLFIYKRLAAAIASYISTFSYINFEERGEFLVRVSAFTNALSPAA